MVKNDLDGHVFWIKLASRLSQKGAGTIAAIGFSSQFSLNHNGFMATFELASQ